MIIQLTPDEIKQFASKVAQWHYECLTYILERANFDRFANVQQLRDLRIKYEKEHPQPSWKSLL